MASIAKSSGGACEYSAKQVFNGSVYVVGVTLLWRRLYSQCNGFLYGVHLVRVQLRRNKLNTKSYGDNDDQLITVRLGFRVTSAEHQKGVYIVNVTDIIEGSIGDYVDNTGSLTTFLPYTYFSPMHMPAYF